MWIEMENAMNENDVFQFSVSGEESGKRLDAVLTALLEDCSRSYVAKLIASGAVTRNGSACTVKRTTVQEGDAIAVRFAPPALPEAKPEPMDLDIVYEDDALLVVNKPAGMVVHPAAGNWSGTLVNGLLAHCEGHLSSINGVVRPGIVHRIDKDTSGLLVVAKTDAAHRGLSEQLEQHTMTRAYRAIAVGTLPEESGTVNRPLGRDPRNRLRMACVAGGKPAVTHWRVLERFAAPKGRASAGSFTYVECRLETGRTHQIRVHLASVGHPLAGDPLYGVRDGLGLSAQMLHAYLLGFVHPITGAYLEFEAPLPAAFINTLEKLRSRYGTDETTDR